MDQQHSQENKTMKNKNLNFITTRFIIACAIVIIGIILLLGNLDILYPSYYLRYWPVIIIIIGINYLLQDKSKHGKRWGWILTILGTILLLNRIFTQFSLWDYWPLILIALGVSMLLRSSTWRKHMNIEQIDAIDSTSFMKATAILSGFRRVNNSQDFKGGELTAIMGGLEINLRNASIKDKAVLDIFALMGGVELFIPDDWVVIVEGFSFLGGFKDKTHPPKQDAKQLIIRGNAIMGGVEIKN